VSGITSADGMTTEIASVGISDVDGLSVTLHTEIPPGGTAPDRLAIDVRIPFSTLRTLMPPTAGDAGKATARHPNDSALVRFRKRLKLWRQDSGAQRIDRMAAEVEAKDRYDRP